MASIDKVVYIDPIYLNETAFDGKKFDVAYNKKAFISSSIKYDHLILHSFKVPITTSDEELSNLVEIRIYEDTGLDLQKKYKISYIKKELDYEENFLVEAYAIEVDKVSEYLSGVLKKTKHIDFLALPFLSYSTLYKNKIIAAKNDIFVYLGEEEAFLSIYKDGRYLSSKGVVNIDKIAQNINNAGYDISSKELLEILSSKGLDPTLYERGESILYNQIEAEFTNIFTKVNDIVIYNRSVFGFEKIDRIFLSTNNGRIKGLKEFIQNFGFSEVELHDFNLFNDKFESNFLNRIIASYVYDKAVANDNSQNVTLFPREDPFYKKTSGKLLIFALSILVLTASYVFSLYYEVKNLQVQKMELEKQYNEMQNIKSKYAEDINKAKNELKDIVSEDKNLDNKLANIKDSISSFETLLKTKDSYSNFVIEVNKLLKKYNLATTNITILDANQMQIEIVANYSKRDNIAKFMKELITRGFIGVRTDEIKSDKDIYLSKIEIKR
ncbi:hypothetical protein ACKGJI_05655 [Sulfurospirillum sp. 1307]